MQTLVDDGHDKEAVSVGGFREILDLARLMRKLASEGDWESVAVMQHRRQQMLESFFASPVDGHVPELAAAIREMLEIDRFLIEAGRRERDALSESLQGLRQGAAGVAAYERHR